MVNHTIAFIGGRGLFSNYGGVENATREIAKEFTNHENMTVLVYSVKGEKDEVFTYPNNLQLVEIARGIYQKFGQHGYILACVFHALFVTRPKAVLVFASGPCLFTPLLRIGGIRVISSIRGMDSERNKWGLISRSILRMGEYCAYKFANHFTANSKKIVEHFREKRPDGHFIPNGCRAISNVTPEDLNHYGVKENQFLLFAARLDPIKRLDLLLEVHSQLPESQKLPLVIAGGMAHCQEYEKKLMQYQSDKVIFLGHISSSELAPLMKYCRAFILPSLLEGMSNSLLSAMANSKAIIAADIAENRDVVELDDAVFAPDNAEELKHRLVRVSTNEDFCAELGEKLGQLAKQKYSWAATANKFLVLTHEGLSKQGNLNNESSGI